MGIENWFQLRNGSKSSNPLDSYNLQAYQFLLSMPAFFHDSCALQNNNLKQN